MVLGTMTTKYKNLRTAFLIFLCSLSFPLFCESGKWTIAAQKFKYARGQTEGAVQSGMAEMLPSAILENLNRSLQRNVMPDEQLERSLYKLRTDRQSLYLQLSSEYKKRDALVLTNYSDSKLKSALQAEQKKITEIQDKIDANLEELKTQTQDAETKMDAIAHGIYVTDEKTELSELDKFARLFKNIFIKDKNIYSQESVAFYKNDITSLFKPSENAEKNGALSGTFEKEVVSAGINSLITGTINAYGDYISVTAEVYLYPGAKTAGVVTEVGSTQELELIASSIAMQLLPLITNAMPVEIELEITPDKAAAAAEIYVDDVLQSNETKNLLLDSGVHNIQFISKNYRTAGTSYYFEGNRKYQLKVNFEELKPGNLQVGLRKNINGEVYGNGEKGIPVADGKTQIAIDGQAILGEFIAENGETSFFYIPKKNAFNGNYVTINPKPMNRMSYIDSRRKWMYGSYSVFMLSLIPAFYTNGQFKNNLQLYNKGQIEYEEALRYQTAMNVSRLISIGCGVFWGYELVRYLMAANSVLPQNARNGNQSEYILQTDNLNNGEKEDEEIVR